MPDISPKLFGKLLLDFILEYSFGVSLEKYLEGGGSSSCGFFVWTAAHGKNLTMDNLCKRHICIVDWCCMCKHSGESPNHLLLHCETAQSLWSMVFCLFGVVWVMLRSVVEVMASWMEAFRKSSHADVGVLFCYVLCGSFGVRGIYESLKDRRGRCWI